MAFWWQEKIFSNAGIWQKYDLFIVFFEKQEKWRFNPIKEKQKSDKMIFSLEWNIMFTNN